MSASNPPTQPIRHFCTSRVRQDGSLGEFRGKHIEQEIEGLAGLAENLRVNRKPGGLTFVHRCCITQLEAQE